MDSEFWGTANRERRMRRAHQDIQKSKTGSKIGFAEFERRQLARDSAIKKSDYESRKISMR